MKKLALALTLACLLPPAATRAQNAYITNLLSNTVSVIDTATTTVIATIPVGLGPFGVAVTPDGSKVYITHESRSESDPFRTSFRAVAVRNPACPRGAIRRLLL